MIFDNLLKTRKLYMIWMLPFLLFILVLLERFMPGSLLVSEQSSSLWHIDFMDRLFATNSVCLKGALLLLSAYLLIGGGMCYNYLVHSTTLSGSIYLLLTAGLVFPSSNIYLLLSVILLTVAYINLQKVIHESHSAAGIFNFGFFILLSVSFYPKLSPILLWAFIALLLAGRMAFKDVIALLLGYGAAILLLVVHCYWTDGMGEIIPSVVELFSMKTVPMQMSIGHGIAIGLLSLITLCMARVVIKYYLASIVNQRRGGAVLISLLVFLVILFLILPGVYADFMYIIAIPLAYYYTQYFILQHTKYWGDILFISFLVACVMLHT
jgi:hypothetical protein